MKKQVQFYLFACLAGLLLAGCSGIAQNGSTTQATPLPTFSPTSPQPGLSPSRQDAEPVRAEHFPDPGSFTWKQVASGFDKPVGLEHAGDGSGRLFVLEQEGVVRILKNGRREGKPFLDIRDRVGSSGNEQGLLGLAFHPRYPENGYFFIHYTDRSGDTVVARYRVSADPDKGDPATEEKILQVAQPFANHNGGKIAFGPDGYLYIGLGDGGSGGDPQGHGQNLDSLLGKLLRLDIDGGTVPENPFAGTGRPEVWVYGLRNPWRFSFDRHTGALFIADVGQNSFEEINFIPSGSPGGQNFGWNVMEGLTCFRAEQCNNNGMDLPVFVYPTRADGNCSVTGGYVYRGEQVSEWQGVYLFGDYCSGRVWGLFWDPIGEWKSAQLFDTDQNITSFGEDESGELYLVGHRGKIFRLERKN
jgi:glucose/arabinose dehydrogenase